MASAKDILIKPIKAHAANALVKKVHYSGKVAAGSTIHLGVFLNGKLEGALQFGTSINIRGSQKLVKDTLWNDFIELNRMAFTDNLPRFSESRAIGISIRLIKKKYPNIKWVLSFSDGCQCGDGTIYRASGFVLTNIGKNNTMYRTPEGEVVANKTFNNSPVNKYKGLTIKDCTKLVGYQLRYVYFIDKSYIKNLTVPIIPFSEIDKKGAGMYKGDRVTIKYRRDKQAKSGDQLDSGGAEPTITLHSKEAV